MIYDFIIIDPDSDVPLWRQIYHGMAEALEREMIEPFGRLPSIRDLSEGLGISRSPVENAYVHLQLDGFIESRPKSGYFALKRPKEMNDVSDSSPCESKYPVMYDLSSVGIDSGTADIPVWRKHLRAALNMQDKIISAGDPQGESELREALLRYCFEARKVKATADRIVIASGTQQLLTELCRMIGRIWTVVIERPGYVQGERIFNDFGWKVEYLGNAGEITVKELRRQKYDLFADITSNRPQMPLSKISKRRKTLIDWAQENNSYILEDDYNGELRYFSHAVPSLQGACPERVIYIGSFSRLLLPSVRIAYMVVPRDLAHTAGIRSSLYDQTSSKIEQLALAEYIRGGHLERHIRRSRKTYQVKSKEMLNALNMIFRDKAECRLLEASLCVSVKIKTDAEEKALLKSSREGGIMLDQLFCSHGGEYTANLSFAGIPLEKIRAAVNALYSVWHEYIS
ncbi:MAG: PLP-dependent aminotransferase family protein [Synergistaceae bacterium]|nr:PLP-dependent aminotransferase family protein [Synergistaceae bacterium]